LVLLLKNYEHFYYTAFSKQDLLNIIETLEDNNVPRIEKLWKKYKDKIVKKELGR